MSQPISEFAIAKDKLIEDIVKSDGEKLEVIGKILWTQACQIILDDTLLNVNVKLNWQLNGTTIQMNCTGLLQDHHLTWEV